MAQTFRGIGIRLLAACLVLSGMPRIAVADRRSAAKASACGGRTATPSAAHAVRRSSIRRACGPARKTRPGAPRPGASGSTRSCKGRFFVDDESQPRQRQDRGHRRRCRGRWHPRHGHPGQQEQARRRALPAVPDDPGDGQVLLGHRRLPRLHARVPRRGVDAGELQRADHHPVGRVDGPRRVVRPRRIRIDDGSACSVSRTGDGLRMTRDGNRNVYTGYRDRWSPGPSDETTHRPRRGRRPRQPWSCPPRPGRPATCRAPPSAASARRAR